MTSDPGRNPRPILPWFGGRHVAVAHSTPVANRAPGPPPGAAAGHAVGVVGAVRQRHGCRTPGGAQVAAEAMPYISLRRVDCNRRSTGARGGCRAVHRSPPEARPRSGSPGRTRSEPDLDVRDDAPSSRGCTRQRGIPGSSGPDHRHRSARRALRGAGRDGGRRRAARRPRSAPPAGLPAAGERDRRRAPAGDRRRWPSWPSGRRSAPVGSSVPWTCSSVDPRPRRRRDHRDPRRGGPPLGPATRAAPSWRRRARTIPTERARWDRRGFRDGRLTIERPVTAERSGSHLRT